MKEELKRYLNSKDTELNRYYTALNTIYRLQELAKTNFHFPISNNFLLKKCLIYSISLNGISFLNSLMLNDFFEEKCFSFNIAFSIRNIIESSVLLHLYNEGKTNKNNAFLFIVRSDAFEYLYNKVIKINGIDINIAKEKYDKVKKFYVDLLKVDEKKAENLIYNNLGFLYNTELSPRKDLTYYSLINDNMSKEVLEVYDLCSKKVHPHDLAYNYFINKEELIIDIGLAFINNIMVKDDKYTDYTYIMHIKKLAENPLFTLLNKQLSCLSNISRCFHENQPRSHVCFTLNELIPLIYDTNRDFLMDFNVLVRMKVKIILEQLLLFFDVFNERNSATSNLKLKLLNLHTRISFIKKKDRNSASKLYKEAYTNFTEIYDVAITDKEFKNIFRKPLGFLIDENKKVSSYTQFVKRSINNLFEGEINEEYNIADLLILYYHEANELSHPNYSIYDGSVLDYNNEVPKIIGIIDAVLMKILKIVCSRYSEFINDFEKTPNDEYLKEYKLSKNIKENLNMNLNILKSIYKEKEDKGFYTIRKK